MSGRCPEADQSSGPPLWGLGVMARAPRSDGPGGLQQRARRGHHETRFELEGTESGWPGFFRTLRIYLTHFRGQRSAILQKMAPAAGTEAEAWDALTTALGLKGVSVGQRWTAPAGVPALSGVAEYLTQSPYDALLRLDKPG